MAKKYDYRDDLKDIAEGFGDLSADLEDIRDEAQDIFDENGDVSVKNEIEKMDQALLLIAQALDKLENE